MVRTTDLAELRKKIYALQSQFGAAETDHRSGENAALVFVDVGNLTGKGIDEGSLALPVSNVNWRALAGHLKAGPEQNELLNFLRACVYVYSGSRIETIVMNTRAAGFTTVVHRKTNVDTPLGIDIGMHVRNAMDTHRRITIILVSGDGDFARMYDLRAMAKCKGVSLRFWVIGWRNRISKLLTAGADEVTYIDDIDGIALFGTIPMARQMA